MPRFVWAPDFPLGQPLDEYMREAEEWSREWGTVEGAAAILRSQDRDVDR